MQVNIKQLYIYMDSVPGRSRSHRSSKKSISNINLFYKQIHFIWYRFIKKNKQINKWNERIKKN